MGFICPEYETIKSQIIINTNKQLSTDVTKFIVNGWPRNDFVEILIWFKCLINLN